MALRGAAWEERSITTSIEPEATVVTLVNLSATADQVLVVRARFFGEHEIRHRRRARVDRARHRVRAPRAVGRGTVA
ncbi:hypothetical protein ABZ912_19355 [Nonomuraea angiospora]|uniref:hypothetical protein n=1 Tax=Nonomuraea angiospora TaxID=46172 RepID=UPI0033E75E5E